MNAKSIFRLCLPLLALAVSAPRPLLGGEPPRLENIAPGANAFTLDVNGVAGRRYLLQSTTDFGQWTVGEPVSAAADRFQLAIPIEPVGAKFFRLRVDNSGPDTIGPAWPTDGTLLGMTRDFTSAELSWPAASDESGVAGYRVRMGTNTLAVLGPAARSHVVQGLAEGKSYIFRVEAVDTAGNVSAESARMTALVEMANAAPVPLPDYGVADTGGEISFDPLDNDRDANGDPLHIESFSQPAHGQVVRVGERLVYTPDPGFSGRDGFSYTVTDGRSAPAKPGGLAPAAAGGSTRVGVLVAALTAWVVEEPAGPDEFRELSAAIDWLNDRLSPEQAGRVKIKRRGALPVGLLQMRRHIHLDSDDERTPIALSGGAVTVNAPNSMSMSRMTFACDSLVINAGGYFDLVGNNFGAPVTTINLGVDPAPNRPGLLSPRDVAPAAEATVQSTTYKDLNLNFNMDGCGGNGEMDLALNRGLTLTANGKFNCSAKGTFSFERVNTFRLNAEFGADASGEFNAVDAYTEMDGEMRTTGKNDLNLKSGYFAKGNLHLFGAGEATFWVKGHRSDDWNLDLGARRATYNGSHNLFAGASFKADGDAGALAEIQGTEEGTQVRLGSNFLSTENARGFWEFRETEMLRTFQATLGGEMTLRCGFVEFHDIATVNATGGRTQKRFELRDTNLRNQLDVRAFGESLVSVELQSGSLTGQGRVFSDGMAFATLRSDGLVLKKAAAVGGAVGGAVESGVSYLANKLTGGRMGGSGVTAAATGPTVSITGMRMEGLFPFSLTNSPLIYVSGADGAVEIANNILDQAGLITVVECEGGPVRIHDNRVVGHGITIDGDIEGTGRTGKRLGVYELADNDITILGADLGFPFPNPVPGLSGAPGVAIQDIADITLSRNRIHSTSYFDRGIVVSSAKATLVQNTVEMGSLFNFFGSALEVLAGPGGPAVVVGQSNVFRGNLALGPNGHGQFTGDQFLGSAISARDGCVAYFEGVTVVSNMVTFAQNSMVRMVRGQLLDLLSLSVSQDSYLELLGVQLRNTGLVVGPQNGVALLSGNTFSHCRVEDYNPDGGIVSDPVRGNSGLDPDEDINSVADWDGNGCADYPAYCNEKTDGECGCEGFPPPAPQSMPPLPPV